MLGFTLSKLNLLILVMALFAIVSYFMFGLQDVMIGIQANQITKQYSELAFNKIKTDALCASSTEIVPESISTLVGQRFFYKMRISKIESNDPTKFNTLIFSVAERKDEGKILAVNSFDANASFKLYKWDPFTDTIEESDAIWIDPQTAPVPVDSVVTVKEVFENNVFLYVVACSSSYGACIDNMQRVNCCVYQERGKTSNCLPSPNISLRDCSQRCTV